MLRDAVLDNGRGLPDSPGIKLLLKEMQVDVKYYYYVHAKLNAEINEAVARLKIVESRANVQYIAKWALGGLVLGAGASSYIVMSHETGSWLNWRLCTLGLTAATTAWGCYRLFSSEEQIKVS